MGLYVRLIRGKRFVKWVMLLWVAISRCYDTNVCFDAGSTEIQVFHLHFEADLDIYLIFM